MAANQDQGVWGILVRYHPDFGGSRAESEVYALWQTDLGSHKKLDLMKAHVIAALEGMGKPPAFLYHLRMWGCDWIGRAPTAGIGMGFWANQLPMPLN